MNKGNANRETQGAPSGGRAAGSGSDRVSFVMTLWLEPREVEAEPEWRWRVSHVQSKKQAYFTRLADVLAFITSQSGLPAPQ